MERVVSSNNLPVLQQNTEAATGGVLSEKVFLEISQNASGLQLYLKKRFWYRGFSANFAKLLRVLFLQNTFGRLLPKIVVLLSFAEYPLTF